MEHHYQHKTSFYSEGRLGYAQQAVRLITERIASPHAAIADMGSGTGIFSAALLDKGYRVYCVEPNAALQQEAVRHFHSNINFKAVTAPAEATGLPDHSVDGITAASAFHWFHPDSFLLECRRIVKPGGFVFFLYNVRQTDDSFSREHGKICRRYCPGFTGFHHGADKAKDRCPAFFSNGFEEERFPYDLSYTKEQFLSRCLSSSYSLNQTQPDYPVYHKELERLTEEHGTDGVIVIRNHTVVWYGRV